MNAPFSIQRAGDQLLRVFVADRVGVIDVAVVVDISDAVLHARRTMIRAVRIRTEEGHRPLNKQPARKRFDGSCLFFHQTERVDLDAAPPRKQRVQRRFVIRKILITLHMRKDNVLRLGIRSGSQVKNPPDEIQNIPASAERVE